MILRPISAYPSNSVDVDAKKVNTFYTTIQGSSSIVSAYKASIFNANTFSLVYTTDRINLSNTLTSGQTLNVNIPANKMTNGDAYYWVLRLYQSDSDIFTTNSVVQTGSTTTSIKVRVQNNIKPEMYIKINGEKRKISNYTISNNIGTITVTSAFSVAPSANTSAVIYSDFIDSLQFPFYAKTTPILNITNAPSSINSREYTFLMQYSQEQGVSIKWHRFLLLDESDNVISDTDKVYTSLLKFSFNGFITDHTYKIKGFVENIDGIIVETSFYSFNVKYLTPNIQTPPTAEVIYEDNAIKVSWIPALYSNGVSNGKYHFEQDYPFDGATSVEVDNGTIIYDSINKEPLNTGNNFSLFTDATINEKTNGKIISLSNNQKQEYYIEVKNNNINSVKDNIVTFLTDIMPTEKSGQQSNQTPEINVSYIWDDNDTWDDNKYWTENLPFSKRYKITILSDSILIKGV